MGKRITLKQAAQLTGISEWSLRAGIKQGRYPYIKVGIGRGRIFVDIELLEQALAAEAQANQQRQAELFEEYQKEHNPEIISLGSILGGR